MYTARSRLTHIRPVMAAHPSKGCPRIFTSRPWVARDASEVRGLCKVEALRGQPARRRTLEQLRFCVPPISLVFFCAAISARPCSGARVYNCRRRWLERRDLSVNSGAPVTPSPCRAGRCEPVRAGAGRAEPRPESQPCVTGLGASFSLVTRTTPASPTSAFPSSCPAPSPDSGSEAS